MGPTAAFFFFAFCFPPSVSTGLWPHQLSLEKTDLVLPKSPSPEALAKAQWPELLAQPSVALAQPAP